MTLEAIRYSAGLTTDSRPAAAAPSRAAMKRWASVRQAWEAIRAMKVESRGGAQAGVGVVPLTAVPDAPNFQVRGAPAIALVGCLSLAVELQAGAGIWPCRTRGLRPGRAELPCHRPAHRRTMARAARDLADLAGPGGGAGGRNGGGGAREVEQPCARHCSDLEAIYPFTGGGGAQLPVLQLGKLRQGALNPGPQAGLGPHRAAWPQGP